MKLNKLSRIVFALIFAIGMAQSAYAAAKTPTAGTVRKNSLGDLWLTTANFSDLDDTDTWASGISGILYVIVQDTDNPTTQASAGVAGSFSGSTITFYPAEDNKTATVFVFSR